ncbi:MAG: hypothetical protein M1834_002255 [Cirrosporium novae-zelandiae]|nr:MAG: hypothetical protein M1834_002255 [Cirrosporium novae-zelandiae]
MRSSRSSSTSSISSISSAFTSSAEPEETVQIFVKSLTGETIPLSIPPSTTISTLANLLSIRTSLPPESLRIIHAGKHLTHDPSATLAEANIPASTTLQLSFPIRGGMPPRKIRCSFKDCKEFAQRIVGDCGFCSGRFCGKHRMLEDHKCSGLEDCRKESHERNADKLNSERTAVIKGI